MTGVTAVTDELLRRMPLPQPSPDGDKDQRGRILVVAGSVEVPGAALLAGVAALRAGAGKLQIATAGKIAPHVGLAVPEALVLGLPEAPDGRLSPDATEMLLPRARSTDAVLLGPGMMDEEGVAGLARELLLGAERPAFVLDAAALIRVRDLRDALHAKGGRVVLTPHAGEMAALLGIDRGEVVADPLETARRAAALLRAIVVLKGSASFIATPDGAAWSFDQGAVGLATSGSGDTLAGIVAGLLARGATPVEAAAWGVYLHGMAGNRLTASHGPVGFLARELLAEIPRLMRDLSGDAARPGD